MSEKQIKYITAVLYMPLVALLLAVLLVSTRSVAEGADDARNFVDGIGQKVLNVINGSGSEGQKQEQLKNMFSENVDMPWMGQFVLGKEWRNASAEQRENYLKPYKEYMLARYTTRFKDYTGAKYTITDAKAENNGQFVVNMQIKTPNQDQSTLAGYRVRSEGGQFKIVDIIIEGVSLITTQRSEFAAVVSRKGMDGLIQDLENKTQAEKGKGSENKSASN